MPQVLPPHGSGKEICIGVQGRSTVRTAVPRTVRAGRAAGCNDVARGFGALGKRGGSGNAACRGLGACSLKTWVVDVRDVVSATPAFDELDTGVAHAVSINAATVVPIQRMIMTFFSQVCRRPFAEEARGARGS